MSMPQAVGIKTIAAAVGEAEDTIEEVFEPHLLRLGLIVRTPKGRCPGAAAYAHLGLPLPPNAGNPGEGEGFLPFASS